MAHPAERSDAPRAAGTLQALRPRLPIAAGIHAQGHRARRALRPAVRRLHRLSRAARGPHRQRVDPHRRAGHLGAEEARRVDDPREQHRPDDRVGRRIGGRPAWSSPFPRSSSWCPSDPPTSTTCRSRCWPSPAGILGVLMMVPLRRALIVKEHGVLPYPEGTACAEVLVAGRARRRAGATVFMRPRHRRAVEGAVVDRPDLPDRRSATRRRAQLSSPTPRSTSTSRRNIWAWDT